MGHVSNIAQRPTYTYKFNGLSNRKFGFLGIYLLRKRRNKRRKLYLWKIRLLTFEKCVRTNAIGNWNKIWSWKNGIGNGKLRQWSFTVSFFTFTFFFYGVIRRKKYWGRCDLGKEGTHATVRFVREIFFEWISSKYY